MKDDSETNSDQKVNKVTSSLLDAFDLLRSQKDDTKLIGGAKIIYQLQNKENEKDLEYVLKRIVRSLGANIPDVRAGYFATLVTLLSEHDTITVSHILDLIKKELHANSSSKSEVGDVALGQILVCGAVLRSGLMVRSSPEEQVQIIQLLMVAGQKKSYLSTVAYLILLDFVNKVDEDKFGATVWPTIKQDFKKEIKDHNLDSLYFLMVVSKKFPGKVKLRKLIGVPEILCEDNIHSICEKLMAGIDLNSLSHPIFKEIGEQIANSPHLNLFWTSGIDSQLLKHNRNRELVAIKILTTILENIKENVEVLPNLLSVNFFKLFMDWFKGLQTASKIRNKRDDEDDHKIMIKKLKELLNAFVKAMKLEAVDNKIRIDVLNKLLFNPGEMNFTEISGTTVVKSITADLNKDGVKKMAKQLKNVLLNTSKKTVKDGVERGWYNNERVKAAELISYLVIHESVKDDTDFKLTYMKMLMCFSFFKLGGDDNITIAKDLSGAIKSCFYRCLTSRFSNVDNLVTVLSSLCGFICSILTKEQVREKMEKQKGKENMGCWEMLIEVTQQIEKIENKSKVDKVFLILLYQLGLFLFSDPTHVKMAESSIKELNSCYEHYKSTKKSKKNKDTSQSLVTDEPEWIEVLVEVLLSILSTESSVLRSVVQCVFRLLWEYLSPSSIGQIVSVLDPDSESNPLTNEDSDNEDSDSEDDSDEEEREEAKSNGDINADEEDESDSNIEDENDDEMGAPEQLRMAVHKALGAAATESDTESIDADMITDEEGIKLDEALAEAFKQFHQGKGKKTKKDRKDKKALSDFRIRVLDLVDIYLEKDPAMDICLGMMSPLTRCLEFCMADNQLRELENRVRKTIKNLTKVRKFAAVDDVTIDMLSDYLKSIIDKGSRSHFMFQALGDVITYFATFIIYCSQKVQPNKIKSKKDIPDSPLLGIFKEAINNYFVNRNCMLPIIFFHNVLQTEWEGTYELIPQVVDYVFNKDVRQFRRNEGIELIAGFYRTLKRIKPTSDKLLQKLSTIEQNFENNLTNVLKGETGFEATKNFFVALNKLINTMKVFHDTCDIESVVDFKILLETIVTSKENIQVKNNKQVKETSNVKKVEQKKRSKNMSNGHEPQQKKAKISSH